MLYLFDFDGTIADTARGVLGCSAEALEYMGYTVPPDDTMRLFMGPPIGWAMKTLAHVKEEDVEETVAEFRKRYRAGGMFRCSVYEGMESLLQAANEAGHVTAIVSSKPEPFVNTITEHLHIREYFACIAGAAMQEKMADKANNIRRAMDITGYTGRNDEVVMIGDRLYDIDGAKACGIASIGVTYGYGTREELEEAGAGRIAESVSELQEMLLA